MSSFVIHYSLLHCSFDYSTNYARCTLNYARCTMHYALLTMHYALCTINYALVKNANLKKYLFDLKTIELNS